MTGSRGITPFRAGLGARCPACGNAPLFAGFLKVQEHCPNCGLDLRAQDSGDGPVALIILLVGFIIVGAALITEINYGWPIWLHLVVWLPLSVIGCLAMMRPLKAILIALQYHHRRHTFDQQ